MVYKNGWYWECFLQEAMGAARSHPVTFCRLDFSIFQRTTCRRRENLSKCIYQYPYLCPEISLPYNHENHARKIFWNNPANRFFYRNNLIFRHFFHANSLFLHWNVFLEVQEEPCETFKKCWRIVSEFFSPLRILLQRSLEILFLLSIVSVASDAKKTFPRRRSVRCVEEKLIMIST